MRHDPLHKDGKCGAITTKALPLDALAAAATPAAAGWPFRPAARHAGASLFVTVDVNASAADSMLIAEVVALGEGIEGGRAECAGSNASGRRRAAPSTRESLPCSEFRRDDL